MFAAAITASWSSAGTPPLRDELRASFAADLRHVVMRWDEGDRRPAAVREQALFDFVYQTYDGSAWIPQSLFDANLAAQVIVGDIETIVRERAGLVPWRGNHRVAAFGMAPDEGGRDAVRWTVNCLTCHTAEIDGVVYFGAGTKTFDDKWLGESLRSLTGPRWRALLVRNAGDLRSTADAHRILGNHHHEKIDSLTRGRSTAFAASHVEFYMRPNGHRVPGVDEVGRGDVKTPPLWHTAAKMRAGRWYSDGSFRGDIPLMASSMELKKDQSYDALVDVVIPRIKSEFDSVVRHLRPPPYPYAIDRALAERGKTLFNSESIGCSRCHGVYDGAGEVVWPGTHRDVGTDRARLDVVSTGFIAAFDASPLASSGALVKSAGYAATPLTGVWANFPYLHNGSVPTLHHLLGPVGERPAIFEVMAARSLDRDRVGQRLFVDPKHSRSTEEGLLRRFGSDRNWFNTARPGSGNAGHDVWPLVKTDENRRALIEYLKTL
ncbi:MAG TPA: hypothetical protein VEA16_21615 [Vicinamibacterales bacterium]|nr:hypothetical protein [Vicinamibacterales bacterium]